MKLDPFDVIVVGGGPAGVTAALRARELGARTALVERARMGGTCTNDGCVPTRVLAKAARLIRESSQFPDYGLSAPNPSLDFEALLNRTQQVVYSIQEKKQLIKHLEESGAAVFANTGNAAFQGPHLLATAAGHELHAEKFILCVGGKARRLPFPGAGLALTHSDVWSLKSLPRSAAIIGAAATGSQLASIFAAFGSQVHLLDLAPNILPAEDVEISAAMGAAFAARGIRILTGIDGVDRIEPKEDGRRLVFRQAGSEKELTVSAVILAVGWPGNLEELNLSKAGVETDGSYIRVDDQLRTTAPHIYAAGDITGRMMLVQSASYEARIAAENAVHGAERSHRHQIVPHGGFTDPEYGSVGLTEAQAVEAGIPYACASVPYAQLDRAVIDGHSEGFCKLIVDRRSHALVGAHVMGEQALEIVHLVAAGMAAGMTVSQLASLEIAYPTFTAVVGLAARRLAGELSGQSPTALWRALDRLHPAEWEIRDPSSFS